MLVPFPQKIVCESIWNNCMMNSSNEDSVWKYLYYLNAATLAISQAIKKYFNSKGTIFTTVLSSR